MAKGSTFEQDVLKLVFNGVPISSVASSAGPTVLWAALHNADPSSGTGQNQSEIALAAYARVATTRSSAAGGWYVSTSVSGPASVSPVTAMTFPQLTSTSTDTASYWSVGLSSAGTGKILYSGALSPTIALAQNVTPIVTTGSSITES